MQHPAQTLQIQADVTKSVFFPVQSGPEEFEMEFDYSSTAKRLISAQAAARLGAAGEVEWFTLTSTVVVELGTDQD